MKKISLYYQPKILVIILKRYNVFREKRSDMVSFPRENLDISKLLHGVSTTAKINYNLVGVINHYGETPVSGKCIFC
jgi:ubiquitin C-terminal hydrolase